MFNSAFCVISQVPRGEVKPSHSALMATTRERLDVICQDSLKPSGWLLLAQCPIKTLYVGIFSILAGTSILLSLA